MQRTGRLRRGDSRPSCDPRQPGHRRCPQRAALPAGSARRFLEAAAGAAPANCPAFPRQRRAAWAIGAVVAAIILLLRPLASARRRPRPHPAGPPGRGDGRSGRRRQSGPPSRGRHGRCRATSSRRSRTNPMSLPWRMRGPPTRSHRARSRAPAKPTIPRPCSRRRAGADELAARITMEEEHLGHTQLRAPAAGVIVTPRLEERVGQNLARGAELCVVADVASVTAEVAVPEGDASLIQPGQPAELKWNPYPSRTFRGGRRSCRRAGPRGGGRAIRHRRDPSRESGRRAEDGHGRPRENPRGVAQDHHASASQARSLALRQALAPAAVSTAAPLDDSSPPPVPSASRPSSRAATVRPATGPGSEEPHHSPAGARRRGRLGHQESRDGQVLQLRGGGVGTDRALRRDSHASRRSSTNTAIASRGPRSSCSSSSTTRRCSASSTSSRQSTAERSLSLLANARTARKRAAEEKAEGFNPFFILFHVFDPDQLLNRTVKYVRWIWTPPVVAVWCVARLVDRRHLRPALGTDLSRDLRAVRLPPQAASSTSSSSSHPVLSSASSTR